MKVSGAATFWDIERQRTWRIYLIFTFLVLLYFLSVFVVALIFKVALFLRESLYTSGVRFRVFGLDTIFLFVIAFGAAAVHWYYSNRNVVAKILSILAAQPPDRRDTYHKIFNNVVDEVSAAAGGVSVERYILPTGSMNAFALADVQERKVVGITEGLLSRASRAELQAVVAHEVAHIVSNDCLETTIACSLFGMYSGIINKINKATELPKKEMHPIFGKEAQRSEMAGDILTLPLFILLFFIDLCSQLLNMFISREKEYRADAAAVRLTRDPVSLATALYRIGTHWRGAGPAGDQLRPIFILNPQFSKLDEDEGLLPTLFSTHPPLIRRLQAILDIAHADISTVAQAIDRKRERKAGADSDQFERNLMAEHDGTWHGPFTIEQLMTQDWLQPLTRLTVAGRAAEIEACSIPALAHFFEQRKDAIYKVRNICPVCREWLIPEKYEGLYVWRCAFCGGVMADQNKMPRIIVRQEKGYTDRVLRIAALMTDEAKLKHPRFTIILACKYPRACPKCGKVMVHKFYSYAYHVEIDECQECRVTWFDADELEILQCLVEMGEGQILEQAQTAKKTLPS